MTGLAAGYVSGLPSTERLPQAPSDDEAYRFEIGGGQWIFGGDPAILEFIGGIAGVKTYLRKSSVFFSR